MLCVSVRRRKMCRRDWIAWYELDACEFRVCRELPAAPHHPMLSFSQAIALPEELKGEHRARFEKELEKYKQDFAPEDIAEIERYQSRQANRRPQAPPVPPQGASLEAPVTPAPSQASTGEASSPASTELDHDANFAPHKEDEASDGPPAHHRAEHRSTETQDVMPNEKIPCAHYISHQGEEEHDPARKIKKFVVDILEKTEAKAFLKKRANDRSDASCREIAAHRIEVKFGR